jgi:hypothetical protein
MSVCSCVSWWCNRKQLTFVFNDNGQKEDLKLNVYQDNNSHTPDYESTNIN